MLSKITEWKIWAILGSVIAVVMYGLKIRGDHYKRKSEEAEENLIGAEAEGSVREYESAANARLINTEKELKRIKKEGYDEENDDDITASID